MAQTLVSPGVEVTVVDQSQYLPAATNSVPLVVIATASNKLSADGSGVATGTLAVNADKLYLATSQRALSNHYGLPFFYQTTAGTPINGYELNEYGLLAAYSALGVTNQCYVLRANVDLTALTASLNRPLGSPANGTYWLDTLDTHWGIFQWNSATNNFTNQLPLAITNTEYLESGYTVPLHTYGSIGQYAVTTTSTSNPVYYKRGGPTSAQAPDWSQDGMSADQLYNTWVLVGSTEWQTAWATVQGQATPTSLTAGNTFTINGITIAIPNSPDNTVTGVATAINNTGITGVYAANISGSLNLYCDSTANSDEGTITLAGTSASFIALGLTAGTYNAPIFQASPSYTVPQWATYSGSTAEPTGSVWMKTSNVNQGTEIIIKKYNSTLGVYVTQSCPVYGSDALALYGLDPSGGGATIAAGSTYAQSIPFDDGTAGLLLLERFSTGSTIIAGSNTTQTFINGNTFTISATQPGTATLTTATATINGTTTSAFIAAVSATNIPNVSATVNSAGNIVITHSTGGDIILTNVSGTPVTAAGFTTNTTQVRQNYVSGSAAGLILSNWVGTPLFSYTSNSTAPDVDPATGTYWYYSDPTQVDIMISNNGSWHGYQNVTTDSRGYNLSATNATGPIISSLAPTTQTNAAQSPLVHGDLWVNTSDLELYPLLYRWQNVSGVDQWVQIANTDSTTSNGIIFQDARWAPNGTTNPVTDALPSIETMLTSNYLDPDAPNAELFPNGILLWNTRRSGFNVKSFEVNAWNNQAWPTYEWSSTTVYSIGQYVMYNGLVYACIQNNTASEPDTSPTYWSVQTETNTWNSATGLRVDGSPYMGRQSQRKLIVDALRSAIDTNTEIREEQNVYNLIAVPGYPELAPEMRVLNDDINNVAFNIVDTPLRLSPTDVVTWATDNGGLGLVTGDGNLAIGDTYAAAFYPSCQTTDLSGHLVVTAPSHMMLRTIIRSDEVAYPWLAPAGTRRGLVDNAQLLGYIDSITGQFLPLSVGQSLRDVLYTNNVNPITFIPGVGITNFGNKTLQGTATALDRINVARLVCFIRSRLNTIGKQYLFEPNDAITRNEIRNSINSLMIDLVAKRGIYDYLVVCDNTNNTPTTIDQNQLWVDIAIEPVKAVEFIYIPLRIENTGAIAAQAAA